MAMYLLALLSHVLVCDPSNQESTEAYWRKKEGEKHPNKQANKKSHIIHFPNVFYETVATFQSVSSVLRYGRTAAQ